MAKCVRCGDDTQLYDAGLPVCLQCCAPQERKTGSDPKAKPQQSESSLDNVNARLSAAREGYRKALAMQAEIAQLRDALDPGHPDGTQALRNANRDLSVATEKYQNALRDFMNYTDPHRRSG